MVTSIQGTPVVAGIAVGPALVAVTAVSPEAVERYGDGGFADAHAALAAYDEAAAAVAAGFTRKAGLASGATAEVLTASAALATDRGLRATVQKQLDGGDILPVALAHAVDHFVDLFTSMGGLMAERATDLRDVQSRLLAHLVGEPEPGVPVPDRPSVLVAPDLAPADTATLDPTLILALVTERGGPTSHTAIIARQLGIPCVVGAAGAAGVAAGTLLLVDGATGVIEVDPDPVAAGERAETDRSARAAVATWAGPGRTADGTDVKLLANIADGASAAAAAKEPVDGVGLFRTELCFLNRDREPSVDEQADIYAEALAPYADGRHVVVRTLDAGSDKPISFATHPDEENPALGVRGLRLSFADPGLLHRQLDAITIAAERTGAETWVMAPMVATTAEARDFATAVRGRGLRAGVMVEVPSAALLAEQMLAEVDFLSIGTNDLTQYTMAADRMATDLAHLTDPWQPAVLHLVAMTARAGAEAGKPVGVCGEAAADPLLAAVLVGLGVTSLSMAAAAVRPVGAALGAVTVTQCEEMAAAALAATDPVGARAAARAARDRD
ncbi:phosphotransferase system enzyme I (PtsI) [Nocardioides thalensis]|uniref:Phosphoenolpyruvate-protein phosphotransferase n=1 Tax=Nocardioides thalensis TaxID=1914755 RepID=A0A853C2V3_9ACTN|nr:phosphoenolpyruvate--protein phosphotransferase [Nocardioides thalensis]NYJ01684.1 phosphotransferase system enzyme I (PtsI) [Nocardioides thalensis]